jgi:hypothetical protein
MTSRVTAKNVLVAARTLRAQVKAKRISAHGITDAKDEGRK